VAVKKRLNITVPADLHARLERHRDRMNVSAICAAALSDAVTLEDAKIDAVGDAMARLRASGGLDDVADLVQLLAGRR
jgi:post-segregation antitoxin (ccd killing protein)